MQNKIMRSLAFAAIVTSGAGMSAFAQSAVDGALAGNILDASGASIPNATITVHNNATNAEQKLTTDGSGYFRAVHLQPGDYSLTVDAPSFASYSAAHVTVQVGQTTSVDAKLTAGGANQSVDVTSDTPLVNVSTPEFSNVIELKTLSDLPVNNYRWSAYALLTPGVVSDSNGYGLLSFRGQSTLLNNIQFDGVDDNQAFYSEERGRTRAGYSTSKYTIQEFQVNTSNYSVEYGRAAGGVVNSITKSGTNAFHGEAYFFDRDAGWGAKNRFTTVQGQVVKPKDWRKQMGGVIGGPIIKDKLFFLLSYDRFLHNFPGVAVASNTASIDALLRTAPTAVTGGPAATPCSGAGAPTSANTTGSNAVNFAVCNFAAQLGGVYNANGTINLAGVTPAQYTTAYNAWNTGVGLTGGSGLLSLTGLTPRTGDQSIWFPKIDWQVNGRNHLTAEVNRMRWISPAGFQTSTSGLQYGIESFENDYVRNTYGIAKLDSVLSTNIVNQIRYQYGRDFEYDFPQAPTPYEQSVLLGNSAFPNTNPYPPNVYLGGNFLQFGIYATGMPRLGYPDERRWQLFDTINYTKGNHSLKFGFDYIHTYDSVQSLSYQYGEFSYASSAQSSYSSTQLAPIVSYLTDVNKPLGCRGTVSSVANTPVPCYGTFYIGLGPQGFAFETGDWAGFAQDEWKASPRLSVTYGLRYDFEHLPKPYAAVVNPALPQTSYMPSDKNNLAPRVGFAWDLFGTGRTTVRGGYGMFFARVINSTIYSALTSTGNQSKDANGNYVSQLQFQYAPTQAGAPTFPSVIPTTGAAVSAAPNATYFAPGFQVPQVHQADLSIEQQVGGRTVVGVSWLGAWGRQLPNFVDQNLPTPTKITYTVSATNKPTSGPLANINQVTSNLYLKSTASTATCPSGRPNCNYAVLTGIVSNVNSDYEAAVVQIRHQATRGLAFSANYTFSHALDSGENNQTFTSNNSPLDANQLYGEYGNSNQNIPNRFVANAVYNTQWNGSRWQKLLLADWEIAPSYSIQNGLPYSINVSGAPTNAVVNGTTVAVINTGASVNGSGGSSRLPSFARNAFNLPRTQVLDLRLSKRFDVTERIKIELLGESFNLANHVNVTSLNTTGYSVSSSGTPATAATGTLTYQTSFGAVTGANNSNFLYSPRQIQLGTRVQF